MDILVLDDHQLFVDGLSHILSKLDPEASITEASSVSQATEILESNRDFDLVLLDLNMPEMNGLSLLQRLHEQSVRLPLVVISAEESVQQIQSAMALGALGFIPKSHSSQQMLSALEGILDGNVYLPPAIQQQMDYQKTMRPPTAARTNPPLKESGISRRQYEVLQLLAQGYSNKQIASTLFLTEHTVKVHISALFKRLKVRNRTECVQTATAMGVIA